MLLVLNSGSSSVKLAVFDADLRPRISGQVSEIGGLGRVEIGPYRQTCAVRDHRAALQLALDVLAQNGLPVEAFRAAAHRVVHGGGDLVQACRITPQIEAAIEACVPLAPLHNPANLAGIRALAAVAPDLAQYASFDTAFHATNPDVARRYAIPAPAEATGLRRFGFHGLSYAGLVARVAELCPGQMPARLLALHLGNGASICAIKDGRSVATTMGYSPLDGLTMGTRAGSMDGNAVLRLAADHGIARAGEILNKESGLLALGGHSDMRSLHAAKTPQAAFAVAHFCYWAVRHAGSMIAAMGGLDAVAFTGGIGEHDAHVRAQIIQGLAWLGLDLDEDANVKAARHIHRATAKQPIWIIPAEEEAQIAREAVGVMAVMPS